MRRSVVASLILVLVAAWVVPPASSQTAASALSFYELTPCVAFDTRPAFDSDGPGALAPGEARTFHIVGSVFNFPGQGGPAGGCGIPGFNGATPQAQAVHLNLVAIDPQGQGQLKVWATDDAEPAQGGLVNFQLLSPPMNNSNAANIGLRQDVDGNDITVKNTGSAATHVRGVVLGYFAQPVITGADIENGTITGADIENGTITGADVDEASLDPVPDAINAETLDGLDSSDFRSNSCRFGYVFDGAICWEDIDQGGHTLASAANRCRQAGGRLPLLSEFMALNLSGITIGNGGTIGDWTANTAGDGSSIYINANSGTDIDGVRPNTSVGWARCVQQPVNALGSP